jgi:ABC-type polar amino acid transport system ATPase subunit
MIETVNLVKRYGSLEVLKGISLTVQKGEVAAIIGPSGGGKSTFIRCINGLESFQDGEVKVGEYKLSPGLHGREMQDQLRHIRQKVGMVFQQFNLFPHLTVLENVIEGPTQVLGMPRAKAIERGKALLERVGLATKFDQRPDRLSGGQQQRVAIARALAMEPQAILFDEPTSALDPRMTAEVLAVLADLAKSGQTMIVVTHAMSFARRGANRVYVFADGYILESGPPEQIFENPQKPATAAFVNEVTSN